MRKTEPVTATGNGRDKGGPAAVRAMSPERNRHATGPSSHAGPTGLICVTHLSNAIHRQITEQVTSARNGDQK